MVQLAAAHSLEGWAARLCLIGSELYRRDCRLVWQFEESGYSTNGGQTWTAFPSFPPWAVRVAGNQFGGTIAASTPENIIWAPSGGIDPYYTLEWR